VSPFTAPSGRGWSAVTPAAFRRAWAVAAATYGVGDVVTTLAIVQFVPGLVEANPLVSAAMDAYGTPGLVAVKLGVFLAAIAISVDGVRADDRFTCHAPPAALAVVGVGTTAYNLLLLLTLG
jgi:hypothetical protein